MNAPSWAGRSVLVTGGTGFIGANLVRALLALRARTHVLLRPTSSTWRLADCIRDVEWDTANLCDFPALARVIHAARPDFIFHLATARGIGPQDRARYATTGILGATHLIEALRQRPQCKLVVAGTSLEYAACEGPIPEDHLLAPNTLHGAVKAAAGLLYRQAAQAEGLAISQLRLFHVYGAWESGHRFLPTAIEAALAGKPVPLAAGDSRRDWVHVDDVVDAFLRAAGLAAPGEIFNVGTGVEHGNHDVLAALERVTGQPIQTSSGKIAARPTDSSHRHADITLARRRLGWVPKDNLADGIRRTLAWRQIHPQAWKHETDAAPIVL